MLVSVGDYQTITGDTTSATAVVEDALADAQQLLEERLGRGLELEERTERVRVFPDGAVYPTVTPLVSVPTGATVQGAAVMGAGPVGTLLTRDVDHVDFVYSGGFDPDEDDRSAVTFLPEELRRAIAWAAKAALTPVEALEVPAGATSVSVGDVSISWGPGGSPATGEIRFSRSLIRRWRFRRDLAA